MFGLRHSLRAVLRCSSLPAARMLSIRAMRPPRITPAGPGRPYSNGGSGEAEADKAKNTESTQEKESEQQQEQQGGSEAPPQKDVATLEAELAAAVAETKRLRNELAYALADIDNVRKIAKKDVTQAREYALKEFGKDLLDVSDTLERALSIFPAEARNQGHPSNSVFVGIEMTAGTMRKVMEKHGITQMEIKLNETEFDPNYHMAVFQQQMPNLPPGVIFNVIKNGYMLKNRVLRPANVGVTAEPDS